MVEGLSAYVTREVMTVRGVGMYIFVVVGDMCGFKTIVYEV